MEERFLYCFFQRASGIFSEQPDSETTAQGLNGRLETVHYKDLMAVASKWEGKSLEDEATFREYSQKYHQVNLHLMKEGTVIPFRFGTVAGSYEDVEDLMARVYVQVRASLERLRGKVELVVQLFWDINAVLQELKDEPRIKASLNGSTADGFKVGKMLFQLVENRRQALVSEIHRRLSPLAEGAWDGTCRGEEMIMNRSYLVEKAKESLFDQALDQLQEEHQGRLSFKYIGPLPPYSFSDIEFNKGNFEAIDKARMTLGLPEKTTLQEIKATFRRLSSLYHPDVHPEGVDLKTVERFKEVVRAYQTLMAYSEGCKELLGMEPSEYSFLREDVEDVFLSKDRSALRKGL